MIKTIRKGHHRADGKFAAFNEDFGLMKDNGVHVSSMRIKFLKSCEYVMASDDQWDWSKLFGFQIGVFGVHKNSYRFGWRFNPKSQKIEVCKLVYTDGGRCHIMEKLVSVKAGEEHVYSITLNLHDAMVVFKVDGEMPDNGYSHVTMPLSSLRFGNGFYFGGNQVAPHDMEILAEREKVSNGNN